MAWKGLDTRQPRQACGRVAPWSIGRRNLRPANAGVVAGYRYYAPALGRWVSRDPIGEKGGVALHTFAGNSCIARTDALGLQVGPPPPLPPPESGGGPFGPPCPWQPPPPPSLACPPGRKCRHTMPFGKCEYRTSEQAAVPVPNGCGSAGGPSFPGGPAGLWDFRPACNVHDVCYGTCGSAKGACDSAFHARMSSICDSFVLAPLLFAACHAQADLFYFAVAALGRGPYESAQDSFCKWRPCCP